MGAKSKGKIEESKLLKAIAELHDEMEKGDALEEQDPEGGLSTEGKPLSDAAPSGRGETKKSKGSKSSSSSADASSMEKAEDDDSSSSDDGSSTKKSTVEKAGKGKAPPFGGSSSSSSSESASDDDDGDDDESAEKSFRAQAENDETLSKAIDASPVIEAMVDNISAAMGRMSREIAKSLQGIESRLAARIDSRVAKGIAHQGGFNARLAKAISAIGEAVEGDLIDMVKSLANSPAAPRGKAILSKGEVNQPPWSGGGGNRMADGSEGGDDLVAQLKDIPAEKIGDWLFRKSASNQLDSKLIMAWEADRYNVEALPEQVRKALANDLLK